MDADDSDLKKRLGAKFRHITFVDRLKAGFHPPQDRPQYLTDVANAKEDEERRRNYEQKKR